MKIDKIRIKGFKKFKEIDIDFNDHLSVLVGENEVGKSTILRAIDIVLNQTNFLYADNSAHKFINLQLTEDFYTHKTIQTLPRIDIELFLDLEGSLKSLDFSGLHYNNHDGTHQTGIKFVYEFDRDFASEVNLEEIADNRIVPTEYYKATWNTFQGRNYKRRMSPIKMIYLDNSTIKHDIFGNYARQIYNANIEEKDHRSISSNFKQILSKFREEFDHLLTLQENQKFGLDSSKTDILKLLDIYESDISIQDMGKGKENVVRTEMALNKDVFDLVLIDEPESHLSYTRTRRLIDAIKNISQGQVVIASHSSLIVNRLNLKNTIILSNENSRSLTRLQPETARYFEKVDNLDILRFVLAEKVILVEGAAEYIILPKLFNIIQESEMDNNGVDIISMGSISFEKYRELSKILDKKVAVITDNDKKDIKYESDDKFNIYVDDSTENWTLEVSFYNSNKDFFDNLYSNRKTEASYNKVPMPKAQAHMLKNKTENALEIENALTDLNIPNYLSKAIRWISE
ncbi:ATP-dependent nuclease [Bacillus sp. SD088]|uniref:ATP-dependent nuclease n=1 Tax=Bacillus sp. SD088 TaxID=2782012 RepID=UPI001A959999|nr:AAA family ATPase [Bacillus sp. SD088]MBO0994573.1 AAA family ATPase [Bacillus sp. SD088]